MGSSGKGNCSGGRLPVVPGMPPGWLEASKFLGVIFYPDSSKSFALQLL